MLRTLLALGVLAGCAPASPLVAGPDHPTHVASATSVPLSAVSLVPVERPDLPAPLRPATPADGMGHAMAHGAADAPPASADTPALRGALDAYLAVHAALAADQIDTGATRALADAIAAWTESPPPGDPHFWHTRAETTAALRTAADALADAPTLDDARVAYGQLSVTLGDVLDATGVPEGYDLVRLVCGMASVPEGGVWYQATGDLRNPYFGAAMATCGTHEGAVGAEHEGHDHAH